MKVRQQLHAALCGLSPFFDLARAAVKKTSDGVVTVSPWTWENALAAEKALMDAEEVTTALFNAAEAVLRDARPHLPAGLTARVDGVLSDLSREGR